MFHLEYSRKKVPTRLVKNYYKQGYKYMETIVKCGFSDSLKGGGNECLVEFTLTMWNLLLNLTRSSASFKDLKDYKKAISVFSDE